MLEWICILLFFLSYFLRQKRDYKYERILAKQAELSARIAILALGRAEEEYAYQRVLEDYR